MKNQRKRGTVYILLSIVIFNLVIIGAQPVFAAEPAENGVHDIFTAKDSTPLEQFKARVLNRILYLDTEIDVSDLNIAPNDIRYTVNGNHLTGIYAARAIVRQNPFYSTAATTGFPEFTCKDNGCVATVKYTYNPAWTQDFVKKVIAGYDEAMALIKPGDSDFAKILKIHDWIVKNVSYGMSTPYYDFAVGALGNRKAVCAGYAQCNQFLLGQVGIESVYIAANTGKKEPHAWNLVKFDGHWFHVDCTWDRGLGVNPNVNHTYFMLSDAELDADGEHSEDWKDPVKGYPSNNLCSIEDKFYKDNKDIATNEQIAANPITIKHEADSAQAYQTNNREHWRTCPAGVEVGCEEHTGNPCAVCGYSVQPHTVTVTTNGSGKASADSATAGGGTEITLTATPDAGYHFKEWKALKGDVTVSDNKFTMPDEPVLLQAVFDKVVKTPAVDATCTKAGNIAYWSCKNCGKYFSKEDCSEGSEIQKNDWVVKALGHNLVKVSGKAATFDDDGCSAYEKCNRCGKEFGKSVIRKMSARLSATSYTYNGKTKTPSVICSGSTRDRDCTVSLPAGRKAVGKYTITVKGAGDKYAGSKTLTYVINPKGTGIKKPAAAKKAFTAKWSRQSAKMSKARITGYQVQYSLKSNFKSAKAVTIRSYRKTSKKTSKLKGKKTYYVRVRTYMKSGKTTFYSAWSKAKRVKTK